MKYFIVEVSNGLCNRLRALASGWIFAKYLNREFKFKWNPTKDIGFANFKNLFKNKEFEITDEEYNHLSKNASTYTSGIKTEVVLVTPISLDDSDVVILKQTGGNYKHADMSIQEFNSLKSDFYKSLQPIDTIQDRINSFIANNALNTFVGVHIRRTDRKHITPSTEMFGLYINRIKAKQVFLCTDDKNEIDNLKKYVKIIKYPKKIFNRNGKECVQEALIEWKLLSMCKLIVYSQASSFGYEACIPNKLCNSKELRKSRKKNDNEERNLPKLKFN